MAWDGGRREYKQVGTFVDGKRHGRWQVVIADELIAIEHWRDGVRHGPKAVYDEGSLLSDEYYWNGKLHGRMRTFLLGELARLGWAVENRREGLWCYWDGDRLYKTVLWVRDFQRTIDESPRLPCPHTEGAGRRHADPRDRDYRWPRDARAPVRRPF